MKKLKKIFKKLISSGLKFLIPVINLFLQTNPKVEIDKTLLSKISKPSSYRARQYTNKKTNPHLDLSIIIPVYNAEKYLTECLDSIINNKTKYNYEIICINDGSTDTSLNILNTYSKRHNNITVITQENRGASRARNIGLDNATGKYIAFIDCDDYVSNNYLDRLLEEALKNDCDLVKCGYYRTFATRKNEVFGTELRCDNGIGKDLLKIEGFLTMGVIKRELLFDIRLPEGYWYEDMIVRPLILHRCQKFIGLKDCLYYYRQHPNNLSKTVEHSSDPKCLNQFYLANYLIDYAKDIGLNIDDTFKLIMLREYGYMSYSRLKNLPKNLKKTVFLLASSKIEALDFNESSLESFSDKYFYQSFVKRSYLLYTLTAIYTKWK